MLEAPSFISSRTVSTRKASKTSVKKLWLKATSKGLAVVFDDKLFARFFVVVVRRLHLQLGRLDAPFHRPVFVAQSANAAQAGLHRLARGRRHGAVRHRNHPLVTGKLLVDKNRRERESVGRKAREIVADLDLQRIAVVQVFAQFDNRLARQNNAVDLFAGLDFVDSGASQPMAVGGDHRDAFFVDFQKRAVEIAPMRMNPHRITREIDQAAHRPRFDRKRGPDILAFAHKRKLRRLHRAQIRFGAAADDFGHVVLFGLFHLDRHVLQGLQETRKRARAQAGLQGLIALAFERRAQLHLAVGRRHRRAPVGKLQQHGGVNRLYRAGLRRADNAL